MHTLLQLFPIITVQPSRSTRYISLVGGLRQHSMRGCLTPLHISSSMTRASVTYQSTNRVQHFLTKTIGTIRKRCMIHYVIAFNCIGIYRYLRHSKYYCKLSISNKLPFRCMYNCGNWAQPLKELRRSIEIKRENHY